MNLSPRLEYILSLCEKSAHTVDVGTDHGMFATALIDSGIADHVTATDINIGPLSKARETIKWFDLGDKIDTRLTDGLAGIEDADIDQVVIAGMGGELIARIIDASPLTRSERVHLVVQPMTKVSDLRRYFASAGFRILREGVVSSGYYLYEVITARYDGVKREISPLEAEAGCVPFEDERGALDFLYEKKIRVLEKRLIGAEKNDPKEAETIRYLISEITRLKEEC